MKKVSILLILLGGIWLVLPDAAWGKDGDAVECVKSASFLLDAGQVEGWQYAPDREVEMKHLALDVTPNFEHRSIQAQATLRFVALAKPVEGLKLDAVDLDIQDVKSSRKLAGYQVTAENLILTFAEPLAAGDEATVTVTYAAEPTEGLYFRTPAQGYKAGDTHLFTQGEEIEARHWYPCLDSPNEKFTSEVTCRVPRGMTVISNGRLVSSETDGASGLQVVHWSQELPHANYLITLVAGYFNKLEDSCGNVPIGFFTVPSESNQASNSFRDTKDIMKFFEAEIGVPYPWAKYDQVCVNDFVVGGMENTSATTLTDNTLFSPETENIRTSEGLTSHEMAHQWFGDLVTCKDWSQIWLNEGFATYYATLYTGHKEGRDAMLYGLYSRNRSLTEMSNDVVAIVRRDYRAPHEMFGGLTYAKASMVLHMLRCELGEELYRRCIRTYLERHRYGNVVSEDLREVVEELSGRSFDQFFEQWLYHAHFPELDATYAWDEKTKLAKVSVRQTQALSDKVLLFNFPLTIRFAGRFGTLDRTARVTEKDQEFYFALDSAPSIVRLNPETEVLARIHFPVSRPMLEAQLTNQDDALGRVDAAVQLGETHNRSTVSLLETALRNDPFYGVRLEAARSLAAIHTSAALEALRNCASQSDARVRMEVAGLIGKFYQDSSRNWALERLDKEKNPAILAEEIRGLGSYPGPEVHQVVERFLAQPSFRNELASAAIAAARAQADPAWIAPLVKRLAGTEGDFSSRAFSNALETVAFLGHQEENKKAAYDFIASYANHPRRAIALASLAALGALGDDRALAVLEKFAAAARHSPDRAVAENAIETLRAGSRPTNDLRHLREEVLDLEKANRDLRARLTSLEERVEASGASAGRKSGKGRKGQTGAD